MRIVIGPPPAYSTAAGRSRNLPGCPRGRGLLSLARRLAQVGEFSCRARLRDVKSLRVADPQSAQLGQYFGRLDPLGDGLNAHGSADLADRLHHAAIDPIAGDVFDELPVDLEVIDRESFQVHERGQAAAEIVQGKV